MISGKIDNGFFWIAEATKTELETIHTALCVQVPGAEHTSLYKQGKWDGYRKFFNWHYKSFAKGLMGFVSRKTGYQFDILNTDCFYEAIPYVHFRVRGHYDLRDFQVDAIQKMLRNHGGLAHLATNAGKTACMAGICLALKKAGYKVAVLEKMEDLLVQVKEEIESCTGLELGEYSAREKTLEDVTILMVPSIGTAMKRIYNGEGSDLDNELFAWLKSIKAVIIDEAHHSVAESYKTILEGNRQAMRFGFSGTIPDEGDFKGLELRELFGDVVCRVTNKELIDKDISARPLVRMIEYRMEEDFDDKVEVYKSEIRNGCFKYRNYGKDASGVEIKRLEFSVPTYTNLVRTFVMNYSIKQCEQFTHILEKLLQRYKGKSIVLLVDWIDYGESLGKRFKIPVFMGQTKDRETLLKSFAEGKIKEIIATSVIDEGLSIDRIEVLILATAGSSERQFLQRLGRGLRKKLGENQLILVDFCRWGHAYLIEPSRTRIQLWKAEGFELEYLEPDEI